jgi:hypothetical protein
MDRYDAVLACIPALVVGGLAAQFLLAATTGAIRPATMGPLPVLGLCGACALIGHEVVVHPDD